MAFNLKSGVTFNDLNSYTDLGLILKSKVIGMPTPKTTYISIAGRDGDIDLTNATSNITYYNNRKLEFEFMSLTNDIYNAISFVTRKLHGKYMRIQIDDDQQYYYMGRVNVDSATTKNKSLIFKMTCNCEPYKYNVDNDGSNWLWDSFSFIYGVIRDYSSIDIDGTEIITVDVEQMPVVPTIVVSNKVGTMTVVFEGKTYTLNSGSNKFYEMIMTQESKTLTFNGKGTVKIEYVGGVM